MTIDVGSLKSAPEETRVFGQKVQPSMMSWIGSWVSLVTIWMTSATRSPTGGSSLVRLRSVVRISSGFTWHWENLNWRRILVAELRWLSDWNGHWKRRSMRKICRLYGVCWGYLSFHWIFQAGKYALWNFIVLCVQLMLYFQWAVIENLCPARSESAEITDSHPRFRRGYGKCI